MHPCSFPAQLLDDSVAAVAAAVAAADDDVVLVVGLQWCPHCRPDDK